MRVPIQVCTHLFHLTPYTVETLLLLRTRERGASWQGVLGTPLPGETSEAAALREIREKTGLEAVTLLSTGFSFTFPVPSSQRAMYAKEHTHIVEHVFAAVAFATDRIAISDDRVRFEWVDMATATVRLNVGSMHVEALNRAYEAFLQHGQAGPTCGPKAGGPPSGALSTPRTR